MNERIGRSTEGCSDALLFGEPYSRSRSQDRAVTVAMDSDQEDRKSGRKKKGKSSRKQSVYVITPDGRFSAQKNQNQNQKPIFQTNIEKSV